MKNTTLKLTFCVLMLSCVVALAPPPVKPAPTTTTTRTGMTTNQWTTNKIGSPINGNVILAGPSNLVIGDLSVSGRLGMGTASAQVLAINSIVISTNYNPTNFIPIPGKIRLSPSNLVLYTVTTAGTNAWK